MTLRDKFADNFTPEAQAAGERLQAVITSAADAAVTAEVRDGAQLHEASWRLVDHRLRHACDCGQDTTALCPHLWAALLAADASGDLQLALKRNVPRRLVLQEPKADAPTDDCRLEPETRPRQRRGAPSARPSSPQPAAVAPAWSRQPQQATMLYILRLEEQRPDRLTLRLAWRPHAAPGAPPPPARPFVCTPGAPVDSRVLAQLLAWRLADDHAPSAITLPARRLPDLLDLLDDENLLRWTSTAETPPRLHALRPVTSGRLPCVPHFEPQSPTTWLLSAQFRLGDTAIPAADVLRLWPPHGGITAALAFAVRLPGDADSPLLPLATQKPRLLPTAAASAQVRALVAAGACDDDDLPEALRPHRQTIRPQGRLYVKTALYKFEGHEMLHAELTFDYAGVAAVYRDRTPLLEGETPGTLISRDFAAEEALAQRLEQLGFRWSDNRAVEETGWKLPPARLDQAVLTLVAEDWLVTAQGKSFRKPTTKTAAISSHGDWFDLEGGADYGNLHVALPDLLEAKQKGQTCVRLDDGTFGILPLDWLENFTALTELGERASERIRFRQQQTALVAELAEQAQVQFDQDFRQRAQSLRDLAALPPQPALPTPRFKATLRPYQQQGLGWLLDMARRGLGACLADDMGLGKTVQLLAFIDVRQAAAPHAPALVVMPRSLLFNWLAEAKRFAPHLAVLDYTGPNRQRLLPRLHEAAIVLTTYGTLRNDAAELAKQPFDACILDESQAIKNADSSTALACRTIRAAVRIAMTGTPIENRLAELLSQLDFTNPGLMGRLLANHSLAAQHLPDDTFRIIRHAVRCLILRRTKQMVADSLPPKTEQVLWVELDDQEQAEYNALRDHFRKQLDDDASPKPGGGALDALTALLKLRQAACHPALVFKHREHATSAKLELLTERLTALAAEGHKTLIFSQFTSLLRLVADRLLQLNLTYAYLDGQTADRQAAVRQFQEDPDTRVFLISLKAGGVGLNLTAADYVFILDPWWNPAAEAQAIDRAYRIGQTKPVFAYKLIARNTVEEKVLKLQQDKQRLADTYLKPSAQPAAFTRQDLLFLLS
ncbi:MAG: DEAD/DEAH box helicase [Oligosphaeraceae bacterium]